MASFFIADHCRLEAAMMQVITSKERGNRFFYSNFTSTSALVWSPVFRNKPLTDLLSSSERSIVEQTIVDECLEELTGLSIKKAFTLQ